MFFECIAWVVPEILVVSEPVVSGRDAQVKIETVETVELKDISVRDTQSANVALASGASEFHIVFAVKSIQSPVGTLKRTVVTHVHTYFRRHGGHVVTVAFGFAVFQPAISSFHSDGVSAAQIGFQFNVGGDKSSPGGEIGFDGHQRRITPAGLRLLYDRFLWSSFYGVHFYHLYFFLHHRRSNDGYNS